MTAVANLLARKQMLRLQENPGPRERDEIGLLLQQIERWSYSTKRGRAKLAMNNSGR
jgi:hypothetical protein